ncbi:antA/AntB antirepressor family protein [Bacteroides sp.]|uniref:antA/AntB antirepressor family protein n=1 Tax=Bacteroides sp. TaxID=29523 RepID=UPI0026086AC9|nr:antA/AntB antirepressor family protein [Bacteroides sp.]MDD3040441.1 antA/AntB antirepressor family protein [Bacteroides sp.]
MRIVKNCEYKLAEKRWEDTFAVADTCLALYNEGMTIEDIIIVMNKNLADIEASLKLAQAFPPGQRIKNVPITVYQAVSKYPNPQIMLEKAWGKNWYAPELNKDFRKFRGEGFPVPVPVRIERQTPIEIALGVDGEGMTTAKKLHCFLELRLGDYSRWVRKNIEENIYAEPNIDYWVFRTDAENLLGGRPTRDYKLTATFAKKLAMSSQTPKGEEARKYFIRVEQNAKAIANGSLDCMLPQCGAMSPDEAAKLILETAAQFKNNLPKACIERMVKTALEIKGVAQVN